MRINNTTEDEEVISRRRYIFGDSLPYGNRFTGLTAEDVKFFRFLDLFGIIFGKWTVKELIFLIENKKNAINPRGDSQTVIYCPTERIDELVCILKEKFGKLTFGETNNGQPYIAVDNERHILFIDGDGSGHFVMHRK